MGLEIKNEEKCILLLVMQSLTVLLKYRHLCNNVIMECQRLFLTFCELVQYLRNCEKSSVLLLKIVKKKQKNRC